MAKKNTLNDLNEFLKVENSDSQENKSTETPTTNKGEVSSKEAFLAKEPSQLVEVTKASETKKTPAKKTTAKKTSTAKPKTTTRKTTAKKTTTKATAKSKTPEITEESLLKQLDVLAKKEGKTMREVWASIARKVGAEFPQATRSQQRTEDGLDTIVDIAMAPMHFLVSVSDRINKML